MLVGNNKVGSGSHHIARTKDSLTLVPPKLIAKEVPHIFLKPNLNQERRINQQEERRLQSNSVREGNWIEQEERRLLSNSVREGNWIERDSGIRMMLGCGKQVGGLKNRC